MKCLYRGYVYEAVDDIPLTIEIDGIIRETRNSVGKLIHPTQQGIINFWRWFGNSKLVDGSKRPLVLYHGSESDFDVVDVNKGIGKNHGTGMFLSNSIAVVNSYAHPRTGNVMPVYVKALSSVEVDGKGANWNQISKSSRINVPSREIVHDPSTRDTSDDEMFAALGGDLSELDKPRPPTKVKGFKSSLGKAFPNDMKYSDDYMSTDDLSRWARNNGHSVIVMKNVKDVGPYGIHITEESRLANDIIVVFSPSLVKSALGNDGSFGADLNITRE